MVAIIERLRRLNSPEKEVVELAANLQPQSELDSQIRDFFTRMVRKIDQQGKGPLTLDLSEPNPGNISWEITLFEGKPVATIWWTP